MANPHSPLTAPAVWVGRRGTAGLAQGLDLLERTSQRQVHAHYLASLAPGGRVEIGEPRPVRSPTAGWKPSHDRRREDHQALRHH